MIKRSGKAIVKAGFNARRYGGLLAKTLPVVIETEAQNRRLLKVLKGLMDKGENLTPEESKLMQLLGHLIQEFEQRFYQPESPTPLKGSSHQQNWKTSPAATNGWRDSAGRN